MSYKKGGNVTGIAINVLVTDVNLVENKGLLIVDFLVNSYRVGMLLRIMNLLHSAETPFIFCILEVIEFNQVTALNEVLGSIEVI